MTQSAVHTYQESAHSPSIVPTIAARNAAFERLLPNIRRDARIRYRHLPANEREEDVQEIIVSAFLAFTRLCERNKQHVAFATPLAQYAASPNS